MSFIIKKLFHHPRSTLKTYSRMINTSSKMMSTTLTSLETKEKDDFQEMLPVIIDSIVKSPRFAETPSVADWLRKVMEYNLVGGKLNRGMSTVFAYEMLENPSNITSESIKSARILGWCVELLQSYLVVLDDIMDSSETRRGVPCWYKLPEVGLGALNDSVLLYSSILLLIKQNFGEKPYYRNLVETFNEVLFNTSMGQHLDYEMAHRNKNDYSLFTYDRYVSIVKYKTAYYTYKLPVFLAMHLCNISDRNILDKVEEICLDIGIFFQTQDDYIDCYGEESVTGKKGTDIQEGKCTWLAVKALERSNDGQILVFESCYGSKAPAHVERIKYLYHELNLRNIFKTEERKAYESIISKINKLPEEVPTKLFIKLVDMIYKREV